jgi:hypothetical protein
MWTRQSSTGCAGYIMRHLQLVGPWVSICSSSALKSIVLVLCAGMCRWGLANAERMMVKPDHLTLDSLMSRKGYTGEVRVCAAVSSSVQDSNC